MDPVAVQIAIGLVPASLHALVNAVRQRAFDAGTTITVFLGGVAAPSAIGLLHCALEGDPSKLPASWRIHLAVAGIATFGLAINKTFNAIRDAWAKPRPAVPASRADEAAQSGSVETMKNAG